MEGQIPHSLKVEWMNTALKYLENDSQFIFEYPAMPVNFLEYIQNSIWLCKNIDLDLKSSFKDALRIFSVKYEFKITVAKGHLVVEKMPKKHLENQDELQQQNGQQADEDSFSTDCEDDETDQTLPGSPTLHQTHSQKGRNKIRPRIRRSKTEKFFIDTQKIIESISPVLLKKSMKNILDFLLDKEEASIIFSNLAPVEARFLENFLGIYKKRQSLEETLPPACNVILNKMCEFFKEFDKQCKLEVYAAKFNANTTKREVKFMKVPRYTRNNAKQPQTNHDVVHVIEHIQKTNRNTPNPNFGETIKNNSLIVTISNGNTDCFDHRKNREVISSNAEVKDQRFIANKTDTTGSTEIKLPMKSVVKDNRTIVNNIDKVKLAANDEAKDMNHADSKDSIENKKKATDNKEVIVSKKAETEDNRSIENEEVVADKLRVSDGELIKEKIDEISKKTVLPVNKSSGQVEKPIINNNKTTEGSPVIADGSRKEKLLRAMSTPMQSDKGSRMMRLMGWEGGALGLRGEGITEPIIPALNIVAGKGLGHVTEIPKPKPAKPVKPAKTDNRVEFLKTVLELIRRKTPSSVSYSVALTKRENKCFNNIIHNLNTRTPVVLTAAEHVIVAKIENIMETEENLSLDMVLSRNSKELTINKSTDRILETKADKKKKLKLLNETKESKDQMSLDSLKIYFCTSVLDFMKSDHNSKEICFFGNLSKKFFNFTKSVCICINQRTAVPFANVAKLCMEILEHTKDCYLDAQFDLNNKRSVLLRKLYFEKPCINKEVLKCAINKYTNSKIPDEDTINNKITEHAEEERVLQNVEVDNSACIAISSRNNNLDGQQNSKGITSQQTSPSYEIKKNTSETADKVFMFKGNSKPNNNFVNNSKEVNEGSIQLIEDVVRLAQNQNKLKRNNFTFEINNFKTIEKDLMQWTINSLTNLTQNGYFEVVKKKLHNKELHTNDREDSDLHTNDISHDITDNSRKWYRLSETFLKQDDDRNISLNKSDDNTNNKTRSVNDVESEQCFNEIKVKLANIKLSTDKAEDDIKTETDSRKNGERESQKFDNKVEKHSELDKSQETLEIKSLTDQIQVNNNQLNYTKEVLRNSSKDGRGEFKESQKTVESISTLDTLDYDKDMNINDIKYLSVSSNVIKENSKHCHDIVIIETNIIETAEVHKKIQNIIENMNYDKGFLPHFNYHGVVERGIVYSCHNKDTFHWLKGVLREYNIKDYKSFTNVHKMKINITSFNSDPMKFLELLEVYNKGLSCLNWKITSQNYMLFLLVIVVEIDDLSFKYIRDNNFSLSVGYGFAKFSIGL
ncbi:uncharacterized protein LOC120625434 isoform X2 [Pararge aegeria]|uniref:uncharacterized protein LOC120625434 isoform X2 n=1 Tax=Pararge aegeria TaxID=116150 RepID=UPI0019CF55E0|nr:uncharacterized protein LOC120625434 isoform X2 [Pararge aegeria]